MQVPRRAARAMHRGLDSAPGSSCLVDVGIYTKMGARMAGELQLARAFKVRKDETTARLQP
ncbi:hypothetical protein GCM10027195_24240 [Comamonas sediminis]